MAGTILASLSETLLYSITRRNRYGGALSAVLWHRCPQKISGCLLAEHQRKRKTASRDPPLLDDDKRSVALRDLAPGGWVYGDCYGVDWRVLAGPIQSHGRTI